MKKFLTLTLILAAMLILLCGCGNKQIFDTTYTFDYAIIKLPNGDVIEGNVTSWTDFEDADQLQVVINGNTYLVHSSNAVLIDK